MSQSELRIGELASRAGVSIDTVRYYERQRLLPRAARSEGGFRLFHAEAVERIRFIRQAQGIGLSLEEIKELLSEGGADECQRVHDLLRTKLEELDEKIKSMRSFRRTLARHYEACEKELRERGKAAECPVLVEITHTASEEAGVGKRKGR
jgi:MerR family copper efflux transcriptional regulator